MKYFWLCLLFSQQLFAQDTADVLIQHGKIVDGTGNAWWYGSIAVKDGKITAIGNPDNTVARKTIDASGLIIAPGFIDVHTHIEDDEIKNPLASNFIYDGVTTVITGNCGLSKVNLQQYFGLLDSLHLSINAQAAEIFEFNQRSGIFLGQWRQCLAADPPVFIGRQSLHGIG